MRPSPFRFAFALFVAVGAAVPSASAARPRIEVTCGIQGAEKGSQHYALSADLDCTGMEPSALQLDKGDRLYLHGHTLRNVVLAASGTVQTVTGNGRFGISTRPDGMVEGGAPCSAIAKATIALTAVPVTGNGLDPGCGTTQACADLATCGRPPLRRASTCDTSYRLETGVPGASLGVCTND